MPSTCTVSPIPNYENLSPLDTKNRLLNLRTEYEAQRVCFTDELAAATSDEDKQAAQDGVDATTSALTSINNALIDIDDAVPTSNAELMSTFLGSTRDKLAPTTRRTRPMGTPFKDWDLNGWTWSDSIPTGDLPATVTFELTIPDDTPVVDFAGIQYEEDKETVQITVEDTVKDIVKFKTEEPDSKFYDMEHKSCLKDLPCTFEEPKLDLTEEVVEDSNGINTNIAVTDITTGCANGDGLFDKLMTAIDSSIDIQYKNSRLDAKNFGVFYANAIQATLQTSTNFLLAQKELEIKNEQLKLEQAKTRIELAKGKYAKQLARAEAELALLTALSAKKKIPLELSRLTQETKRSEMEVELVQRQTEQAKASTVASYSTIKLNTLKTKQDVDETQKNGVLSRNNVRASIENTRVKTKADKFNVSVAKYRAYGLKVQNEEAKATGAANRKLIAADTRSKLKQASLHDQQRKGLIAAHREATLKLMKDFWSIQIETVGAENMVIEAVKGGEMSSRLERAALDAGL